MTQLAETLAAIANGTLSTTERIPKQEIQRMKLRNLNSKKGNLTDYDCPDCLNRGIIYIPKGVDGVEAVNCQCLAKRRSLSALRRSGLSNLLIDYDLDKYEAADEITERLKAKAEKYVEERKGWFYISGTPGSGKTHLCTGICGKLIQSGIEVKYMLWREDAPRLKGLINTEEYDYQLQKLKSVPALYIDDFFKGTVSEADINLAFTIINARYNDRKKLTLISSERSLNDVLSIDEAVGSRIYERAKGYVLAAPKQNWRLKRE